MKKTDKIKKKHLIKRRGLGEQAISKSLHTLYTALTMASLITAALIVISIASAFIYTGVGDSINLNPIVKIVLAICGFVVIAAIFLEFLGRKLFKPIKELTKATEKVADGNYNTKVPEIAFPSELKLLTESFNKMTTELNSKEMLSNDFIGNFSHEFKTPIISVKGYAKQLKNTDLTEEQRNEYIDIIIDASEKLADLSSQILLLSKYENQQIVTDKTEFYLDEQIRSCIVLYEKQWSRKNIDLDIDMEEVKYTFNEDMLFRVWSNLFINAVKFTPENGIIHITLKKDKNNIVVHIRDEGIGMDEETVKRIFDKFYQGDRSHASMGNGLGLCLAKRVVDLCNGRIDIESRLNKGTDFIVTLPLQ